MVQCVADRRIAYYMRLAIAASEGALPLILGLVLCGTKLLNQQRFFEDRKSR